MRGTLLWLGIYCAWALVFFTVIWPWLQGRIPSDQYHAYLRSDEWLATAARLKQKRRGRRCAACATTEALQTHHVTYVALGNEPLFHLVRLCDRCHGRVHTWSEWVFSSHTRGLVATTALVCGAGKARRLGRRPTRELTSH